MCLFCSFYLYIFKIKSYQSVKSQDRVINKRLFSKPRIYKRLFVSVKCEINLRNTYTDKLWKAKLVLAFTFKSPSDCRGNRAKILYLNCQQSTLKIHLFWSFSYMSYFSENIAKIYTIMSNHIMITLVLYMTNITWI